MNSFYGPYSTEVRVSCSTVSEKSTTQCHYTQIHLVISDYSLGLIFIILLHHKPLHLLKLNANFSDLYQNQPQFLEEYDSAVMCENILCRQ